MSQDEDESSNPSGSSRNVSLVFEKRAGTDDRGKDYEHLFVAHLLLKLITDDTIEDFYLSSNDKKFGSFDDVVVSIKYHANDTTETYAIQLKQSKNKVVRTRDLTSEKGNFSIRKYLEDYNKNLSSVSNLKLILFTNCKIQVEKKFEIKLDNEEFDLQIETVTERDLLSTHKQPWCYKFTSDTHKKFFHNFSIYGSQADVDHLEKIASSSFSDIFKSDEAVFNEFSSFISRWSMKGGSKEKLSKKWVKQVIALCVMGPFIKPLSFSDGAGVNEKGRIICELVSELRLTTVAKDNYEKVKTLWHEVPRLLNDDDMKEVQTIQIKYQIHGYFKDKSDLCKDDKDISKILWLLGKCPLILEERATVYQGMRLCECSHFILLSSKCQEHILLVYNDFRDNILNTFTYSIEGQKEEVLKNLDNENFYNTITIDSLVQMVDNPLVIGPSRDLPPCHVTRTLWKIFIDRSFVRQCPNLLLVVSGAPSASCFLFTNMEVIDFDSGTRLDRCKNTNGSVVYLSQEVLTLEEFDKFCSTKKRQCYQFKFLEQCFEWVRSTSIEEMKKFRVDHEYLNDGISEKDLFGDNENSVNIVCANSGMGKSTLMKSLKRNSPSKTWTILLYARKYALFCRQKLNIYSFLSKLADDVCQKYDDAAIFKELMLKRQVRIIWDGLDEVSSESLDAIINIIKQISSTKIKQWITARNNIKSLLETKLQVFSFRIKEFSGEEQRIYIQNRLNFTDSELFEIYNTVQTKVQPCCNSNILGIPLQIYMLTELFSRNKLKYLELLNRTFTLLDLYQSFVEEKFYVYYVDKLKLDLSIEDNHRKYVSEMQQRREYYKKVAFEAYLGNKGVFAYFQKRDDFLQEIKAQGDCVGFISTVSDDMVPEFVHNSFGEYFAACHLFDHDRTKAKDPKFTHNYDYNNIRFFLDLMLTKNSKVHLAVMNKNSVLLDECSAEELQTKDLIDRGVLELSCSWSRQYEIAKIQKMGFGRFNIHTRYVHDNAKRLQYFDVCRHFAKVEDVRMEKLLLLLPFLASMYAKMRLDDECAAMVIYYCVVFDYVVIFKYVDEVPELKRTYYNFDPIYLLSVALIYESRQCLQEFALKKQFRDALRNNLDIILYTCQFQGEEVFSMLVQHVVDIHELIYFACCQGKLSNVLFLVKKGVKTHVPDAHGRTPIHYSADNEVDGLRIIHLLLLKGETASVFDNKLRHPLHYACMNGYFGLEIVDLLSNTHMDCLDIYNRVPLHYACDNEDCGFHISATLVAKGAKTNVADVNGLTPLHYACMNWKQGAKIAQLLAHNGAHKEMQDGKGRTPLHYASMNYFLGYEIVNVLVDSILANVPDGDGCLPLHYACERGNSLTASILMKHSTEIDTRNKNKQTPLHNACKNYFHGYDIAKLLISRDAKVNRNDSINRQPIHYACEFGTHRTVSFLLTQGAKVNNADYQKRLPIHYACMNIYHSAENVRLLVAEKSKISSADAHGLHPIHYACEKANVNCVQFLVNEGKDQMEVRGPRDRVALHYACLNFNHGRDIVRCLLHAGAKLDVMDKDGCMPIHYACQTGNIYNVMVLVEAMGGSVNVSDSKGRKPVDYARMGESYNVVQLLWNLDKGGSLKVPL